MIPAVTSSLVPCLPSGIYSRHAHVATTPPSALYVYPFLSVSPLFCSIPLSLSLCSLSRLPSVDLCPSASCRSPPSFILQLMIFPPFLPSVYSVRYFLPSFCWYWAMHPHSQSSRIGSAMLRLCPRWSCSRCIYYLLHVKANLLHGAFIDMYAYTVRDRRGVWA